MKLKFTESKGMVSFVLVETCYLVAAQSSFIQTAIWESSLLAKGDLNSITINLNKGY